MLDMTPKLIPCPVCTSEDFDVLDARERDRGLHRNTVCRRCGMVWVNPRFDEGAYLEFYRKNYTTDVYGLDGTPEKIRDVIAWRTRRSREKASLFPAFWPKDGTVLEIGSGIGAFLASLREDYACRVFGVEPSPAFVELSKTELNLPVYQGSFNEWFQEQPEGFSEKFDRIVLDQILEHLLDPAESLARLRSLLADDGEIFISVPNVSAPKEKPEDFFIFEHVSSFSPFPLCLLLLRSGFKPTGLVAERPGSLQITAAPIQSTIPMLALESWERPYSKQELLNGFAQL